MFLRAAEVPPAWMDNMTDEDALYNRPPQLGFRLELPLDRQKRAKRCSLSPSTPKEHRIDILERKPSTKCYSNCTAKIELMSLNM